MTGKSFTTATFEPIGLRPSDTARQTFAVLLTDINADNYVCVNERNKDAEFLLPKYAWRLADLPENTMARMSYPQEFNQ